MAIHPWKMNTWGPKKVARFRYISWKRTPATQGNEGGLKKISFKISTPLLKKYCHGSCQTAYNVLDKITLKVWRVRKLYLGGRIWVLRILGRMKSWISCGHLDNGGRLMMMISGIIMFIIIMIITMMMWRQCRSFPEYSPELISNSQSISIVRPKS